MTRYGEIVRLLVSGGVEFMLVGGVAAIAHGAARATFDVDVVYRRTTENITRLAECLAPHKPYLRGAPLGLPFRFNIETIKSGLNFTLTTDLGDLDLLGEIAGGGTYENLATRCVNAKVFGIECKCIDLVTLIATKRAAGRPKDMEAISELETLLKEGKPKNSSQ